MALEYGVRIVACMSRADVWLRGYGYVGPILRKSASKVSDIRQLAVSSRSCIQLYHRSISVVSEMMS
jgi:hypothetical protein